MVYRLDVIDNAFEFLRYHETDLKEALGEEVGELRDIQNGGLHDQFMEDLLSREYTWMEAAEIIEYCKNEEDDESLWYGRKMEESVLTCAKYSFANDVWELAEEMYTDLLDEYEATFAVIDQDGETVSIEFEDELDAENFIEEHINAGLEVKETNNAAEIWAEFLEEYTDDTDVSEWVHEEGGT